FGSLLGGPVSRAIDVVGRCRRAVEEGVASVLLRRDLGLACVRSARLERFFVGAQRGMYRNGRFDGAQMSAALITMTDIYESVRQKTGECDLSGVGAAILERNGHVSISRRKS
ncbi:YetF domain-containing protein, partial [Burkholderia pseudomallei]|uniref:YetF domain-containing protein n=1 Tax=Burkholderia pseudomallei TaxID=28450 RepID=UPI003CF83E4D